MKGSYILVIKVDGARHITIGRLGSIEFKPGCYAYTGSALNSLESRIERHYRTEKKVFWHIDYLLEHAVIIKDFRIESPLKLECTIARSLSQKLQPIPGFGCSDCSCKSHLYFHKNEESMKRYILDVLDNVQSAYNKTIQPQTIL